MAVKRPEVGATYDSDGMIFTVLEVVKLGDSPVMKVLLLDDCPDFVKRLPAGTVMQIGENSRAWLRAKQIASLPEQGKVSQ